MTGEEFHSKSAGGSQFIATETNAGRDGRKSLRPSRVMHAARRGVTLVELMISMLILTIVCISWLQIIGIQSARKEARRREAVERLVGMMDAFLYDTRQGSTSQGVALKQNAYYAVETNAFNMVTVKSLNNDDAIRPIFDGSVSPIGYQLSVVARGRLPKPSGFPSEHWGSVKWLVGKLYDRSGCRESEAGTPFFTLPVCLGM